MLVNQNGTLNATNYYFPYGDNRGGSQSTLTSKRFTGQYHEAGIGLYFYGARWYDSRLGRFAQADTIVPAPASPMSLNRYMYTNGNPIRYTDPTGHCIPEVNCPGDKGENDPNQGGTWPGWSGGGSGGGNGGWSGGGKGNVTSNTKGGGKGGFGGYVYSSRESANTSMLIGLCWFSELCNEHLEFGPENSFTQDVRYDAETSKFYERWAELGYPMEYEWRDTIDEREGPMVPRLMKGLHLFVRENVEMGLSWIGLGSSRPEGTVDAVGGTVASHDKITVSNAGPGYARIEVHNTSGWASFTRIPGTDQSFIVDRSKSKPGPGGTMTQVYYWYVAIPSYPPPNVTQR